MVTRRIATEALRRLPNTALVGWLFAGFHSLLYLGIIPEAIQPCSQGVSCSGADMAILGGLPLPLLSLGVFSGILAILVRIAWRSET
jgi:hypothetical protein